MREPSQDQNWNSHWFRNGIAYVSKTQAMKEFNLTKKEFIALLIKVYKGNLQLRTKTLQNERYGNYFVVYSVEDLKRILGLK